MVSWSWLRGAWRADFHSETPCGIDPFTYTSLDPVQVYQPSFTTTAIGQNISVKTLISTSSTIAPKSVPPQPTVTNSTSTSIPAETSSTSVRSRSAPKVAFPATHLAELFKLIEGNTKIRTDLVSQLKGHFEGVTTKLAIEAKLNEVAVREGKKVDSQWKIKPEAWVSCFYKV
jgi:chromatin assembly factor 1 subunit A